MNLHTHTKRGLGFWLIALILFGIVSMVGSTKGNDIVLHVANRFHEVRCAKWLDQNNIPKAIEEYKAWLWLDEDNVQRSVKLVELHLMQKQVFEANNRLAPLLDKMTKDEYVLCYWMAKVRNAQGKSDAVSWAKRAQAVASEQQQDEVNNLLNAIQ